MRLTFLNFSGRVSRTICAFTSAEECTKFVNAYTEEDYEKLPTVNPLHDPIPTFDSSEEAVQHFKQSS